MIQSGVWHNKKSKSPVCICVQEFVLGYGEEHESVEQEYEDDGGSVAKDPKPFGVESTQAEVGQEVGWTILTPFSRTKAILCIKIQRPKA